MNTVTIEPLTDDSYAQLAGLVQRCALDAAGQAHGGDVFGLLSPDVSCAFSDGPDGSLTVTFSDNGAVLGSLTAAPEVMSGSQLVTWLAWEDVNIIGTDYTAAGVCTST